VVVISATPTAADNCAGSSIAQTVVLLRATFPIGTTTITYTDAALNTFLILFTVTITDTENPTIVGLPAHHSANTWS
jgi:hypothetical protein